MQSDILRASARLSEQAYGQVTVQEEDAQALVLPGYQSIWIAFRGTESCADIQTDLQVGKRHLGLGYGACVHCGFLGEFQKLEPSLTPMLLYPEITHVYLTGHSLGGALAAIAHLYYADFFSQVLPELHIGARIEGPPRITCHTFGAPRVGNISFARALEDQKHYRIVREGDVIPEVPLSPAYVHAGTRVIELRDNKKHIIMRNNDTRRLTQRLTRVGKCVRYLNPIDRHDIRSYRRLL